MRHLFWIAGVALLVLVPTGAQAQVYGDSNSLVDSWYRTYFGRPPDPAAAIWVNELNQGTPPDQVLATLLGSPEFYTRAGSTPQGFITLLYNSIVQRPPNPNEVNFWVSRMYTEQRNAIADEILTQNPGVWVGSGGVAAPPVVVTPPAVVAPRIDWDRHREWERDRRGDWARHHDIHEYRRPAVQPHRDEHHDQHHDRRK